MECDEMSAFIKKLDKIIFSIKAPQKLTLPERTAIKEGFKQIKEVLDEVCEEVQKMDRDEAYAYMADLIVAIRNSSSAPNQAGKQITRVGKAPKNRIPPNMEALIKQLPVELQAKAAKLECVVNFRNPEISISAICPECDYEKLQECINTFDDSIVVTGEPIKVEE